MADHRTRGPIRVMRISKDITTGKVQVKILPVKGSTK
jgi:hypothetical protein